MLHTMPVTENERGKQAKTETTLELSIIYLLRYLESGLTRMTRQVGRRFLKS